MKKIFYYRNFNNTEDFARELGWIAPYVDPRVKDKYVAIRENNALEFIEDKGYEIDWYSQRGL